MEAARRGIVDLGDRHVRAIGVGSDAPLDPTEPAAAAGAVPPHLLRPFVRIEREDNARLLSGDDQLPAAGQRRQHRRRAEVEVGPGTLAAVMSPGTQPKTSGVAGAI